MTGDPRELILTKQDSGKFDMNSDAKYSQIVIVDGTKTTKGVELIANNNGNTLMGGKGKDILTGGLGADTFVYTAGGGNDTITSYVADEDIIQLGKKTTISKAAVSEIKDENGNVTRADYVFTIGKGKLTVEDGAMKTITFKDYDGNKIRYDAEYTPVSVFDSFDYEERLFIDDNYESDELDSILKTDIEFAVENENEADINFAKNNFITATTHHKARWKPRDLSLGAVRTYMAHILLPLTLG